MWLAKKGLKLDDSLTIRDLAVSGYRGKNLTKGALAGFIAAVQAGRIDKGSYLIVEKLDRFSRADADEALPIFTKLVKSGITIVTLEPEKEWDAESIKGFGVMELVLHFVLANQESQKRSDRLTAVWGEKKRKAALEKLTKRVPSWLKWQNEKIVPDVKKTALVKRIFTLAEKGHGSSQIAKLLNRENVPSMLWGSGWYGSSILKLLRSRTVLGEYQPCRVTPEGPKRRVPAGEPVAHYYPAVVSAGQFVRVQSALDGRRLARGKIGRNCSNLFQGLLWDARDGGRVRSKLVGRSHYLIPKNAERGVEGENWAFTYQVFEHYLLRLVKDITPRQLRPPVQEAEELDSRGRFEEVERRIEAIKNRMTGDGDFDSLFEVLAKLEAEKKQLVEKLKVEQAFTPEYQERDLKEGKSVLEMLDRATGEELLELRVRLKGVIRSLVKEIWLIAGQGESSGHLFGRVYFRSGGVQAFNLFSPGKGVKIEGQSWSFAMCSHKQATLAPAYDVKEYAHNKKVKKTLDDLFSRLSEATPRAIALKMVREGQKPYLVAKELGIANSTVYRWANVAGLMKTV